MKYKDYFIQVKEKKNKKIILFIVLVIAVIFILDNIVLSSKGIKRIEDTKGNLIGFYNKNNAGSNSVPISYTIECEGQQYTENILLNFKNGNTKPKHLIDENINNEKSLKLQVNKIVRAIEKKSDSTIMLPKNLESGETIYWNYKEKNWSFKSLLLFPMLIFIWISNSKNIEKKERMKIKDDFEKGLPAFNNQLMMMLTCGLIFNDAFIRISEGYSNNVSNNCFKQEIIKTYHDFKISNENLIIHLNKLSQNVKIREFSRLVGIISDNQYKGVDLYEKLNLQREQLWNKRKQLAEEKGKKAETKLTFPLAVLLLVLILITAAPAILQI